MADGGGAACIAQLMAAHADDLRVQQICCGALPLTLTLTLTLTVTLTLALTEP